MARVEVELNGRYYAVGCEDGQESRLREIVAFVDSRLRSLGANKVMASETQLMALTLLTLADQIFDLRAELAKLRTVAAAGKEAASVAATELDSATEEKYAAAIDALVVRVDAVASRLAEV